MSLATRNVEPIPGYLLRERIGSGGYGEVWKADAPGGLAKAIKLVYGYADGDRAARELKAMGLIKSLRHPFLLSLERIEIIDGQLIIVTELADCSLKDRFERRRSEGLRGIPRPELLQFMRDAADALDYMNEHHSLQHLDVKPENLLLVGEHVKVADFGLVKDVQRQTASVLGGLTPVYASPELFSGTASRRSDQYSLAIVYQEMLTGVLPFPGKTTAQLATQHLNSKPLLFALPPGERKVVARALAKDPSQRFANCREFVEHLQNEALQSLLPAPESWFGKAPAPKDNPAESIRSTMCLQTARLSEPLPEPAASSSRTDDAPIEHAEPYSPDEDRARTSDDMLSDIDEASSEVGREFAQTFVMRKSREPQIAMVDAPQAPASTATQRPTLIVGIGHVGGLILQRLKRRVADRQGSAEACPAVQLLLLDADSQSLHQATRGDHGAPLAANETMLLTLRKSQDYRNESPALLQWLSRRWLYNIPRSQMPEGLRPLGRLAFADHARTVRDRMRKSLQRATSPDSVTQSSSATDVAFAGPPRVIVLGAICGGTAGGMLLDVAFLARQLLERQGSSSREVLGLLLHYRGRQPSAHDLAVVNSYSTLTELDYYARPEKAFPGDASCGLEPRKDDHAPLSDAYFVNLGEGLNEAALESAADSLAEYVYAECFTEAIGQLSEFRAASPSRVERGLTLRSLGISQVGFSSGGAIPWATMQVAGDLVRAWLGEGVSSTEAGSEVRVDEFLKSKGLEVDAALQTMLADLGRSLPEPPDALFARLLCADGNAAAGPTLSQFDINVALHRVAEQLAQRGEETLGPEQKYPAAIQQLAERVQKKVAELAQAIGTFAAAQCREPGRRFWRADQVLQQSMKQITSLYAAAREQRKNLQAALDQLERLMATVNAPTSRRTAVIKTPTDLQARFAEYGQLRLFDVALFFVQDLARRLKNALTPLADQYAEGRRELQGLLAQFNTGAQPATSDASVESALQDTLLHEFSKCRCSVVQQVDHWFESRYLQSGGSLLATITAGGEERVQLLQNLLEACRRVLTETLSGLDIAGFLLGSPPGEAHHTSKLGTLLEESRPAALGDGTCRVLISTPKATSNTTRSRLAEAIRRELKAAPAIVPHRQNDLLVIQEVSELSIAEVATRLIDQRPDLIEYARRVFSRSDIPFEPLCLKEDDEE